MKKQQEIIKDASLEIVLQDEKLTKGLVKLFNDSPQTVGAFTPNHKTISEALKTTYFDSATYVKVYAVLSACNTIKDIREECSKLLQLKLKDVELEATLMADVMQLNKHHRVTGQLYIDDPTIVNHIHTTARRWRNTIDFLDSVIEKEYEKGAIEAIKQNQKYLLRPDNHKSTKELIDDYPHNSITRAVRAYFVDMTWERMETVLAKLHGNNITDGIKCSVHALLTGVAVNNDDGLDINILALASFLNAVNKYLEAGLNVRNMVAKTDIKKRQFMELVDKGFVIAGPISMFASTQEIQKLMETIFDTIILEVVLEDRNRLIKSSDSVQQLSPTKDKTGAKLLKENQELQEKIERLLKEKEQVAEPYKKRLKECEREIYALTKQLDELLNEEDGDEEIACEEEALEEPEVLIEQPLTPDEFEELIQGNSIAVWGMRPNEGRRLSEKHPSLILIDSNQPFSNLQVRNHDAVIIKTDYNAHSRYYKIKEICKKNNIPTYQIPTGQNNDKYLYEAVRIALKSKEENI